MSILFIFSKKQLLCFIDTLSHPFNPFYYFLSQLKLLPNGCLVCFLDQVLEIFHVVVMLGLSFLHLCLNVVFLQPFSVLSPALLGLWWCFLPFNWVPESPSPVPTHSLFLLAFLKVADFCVCILDWFFLLWTWPSRSHLLLLEIDSGFFVWHFNCFSGLWSPGFTVLPCLFVCLVTAVSAAYLCICISGRS